MLIEHGIAWQGSRTVVVVADQLIRGPVTRSERQVACFMYAVLISTLCSIESEIKMNLVQ